MGIGCLAIFFPGAFVFGFPGVMASQWQEMFQADKAQIGQIMFYVLAGTGFSMYLAGKLQEIVSTRWMVLTGSLACGMGTLGVAHASSMNHVYVWAFFEGFFTGFVYIPCLTFFQRIFPEKKGLITGVVNLTFGGAAAVMAPIYTYFLVTSGYLAASYVAGGVALCIGCAASVFISHPSVENQSGKMQPTLSFKETLKLKSFWCLWLVWALAGASGVSLIVLASSFGSHLGYDIVQSVYILTGFNLLNGVGRLICGRLADSYSKQTIMMTVFLMAALAYLLMSISSHLAVVSFLACFVGLAFGVLFTVSAPLVTDVFGLENFGRIFGLVFTAYGFLAGLMGPWLSGRMLDATGSKYSMVFGLFALFYLISAMLIKKVKQI